jgi:competence protein ComEC
MRRPVPLILSGYIAGIYAGGFLPFSYFGLAAGVLAGGLVLFLLRRGGKGEGAVAAALLIFFLLGWLFMGRTVHPDFPSHHLAGFADGRQYILEGVLYRPPEPLPDKTRLYVRGDRILLGEKAAPVAGKVLLTVREGRPDLRYGDRVRFVSRLYRPRPAANPGAFDYRRFLAFQDIRVTAYVNRAEEVVRMGEGEGSFFFHFVEGRREKIRIFVEQNAPPEYGGIIKALVLGERGDISKELNEKFIVAGVNHLLAISGLHVGLVAAFFFGAARLLFRFFPPLLLRFDLNKAAALAAIFPVVFYTFIAGLGVAAVRATVMALSFLVALLLDREKDLFDAFFLAAFLILAAAPAALFDISFQFSFLAVFALLYLGPRFLEIASPLKKWADEQSWLKRRLAIYAGASLAASAAAILGTAPLVALYFHRVSLVGFLANLLLVPLLGLAGTLLSLLTALSVFLSAPLALALTQMNAPVLALSAALVDFFSRWPLASVRVAAPSPAEILVFYGAVASAANLKRRPKSVYLLAVLIGIFAAVQWHEYRVLKNPGRLEVAFLDVGQGDAAVVRFPGGKTMVIDGGGTGDRSFDPGERIVAPYLWQRKIKHIDFLVNTHYHPDHLQGLFFLLENFSVGAVWVNGDREADFAGAEPFRRSAGERARAMSREDEPLEIGGVRLEVLHPPGGQRPFSGNDASLVLRLTYGGHRFLFCGDIETRAEAEILRRGSALTSTVLKVPHHGSRTSNSAEFVESARPAFAVFTVRGGESARLPNPEVLARYEAAGAKILRTDRDGAVFFESDGKTVRVRTFLEPQRAPPRP